MLKPKRVVLFSIIFLLILAFAKYWKLAYTSFDVSMYMVAAQQILRGARPYVDIIDINPPLIIYIHILIVWCAQLMRSPPLELYDVSLLVANIGVAFFIARKLKALADYAEYSAVSFLVASLHALIAFQYGQREHLFMTSLIPYFCVRWVDERVESKSFYIITILTGLLSFLKPGFLAILVSYEVFLFIYRRKILLGHWILLSVPGAIYLVHFIFLPNDINKGFWIDLVPIVLSRYDTMGLSIPELVEFWGVTVSCYIFLACLYFALGLKSRDKRFAVLMPIGLCSLVAVTSAVLQGKGWEYHLIPSQVFLFFGLPLSIGALRQYLPSKIKLSLAGFILFYLLGQHLYVLAGKVESGQNRFVEECGNKDLKAIAPPGSSIVVFSIHPCFSYPVFYEKNYIPGTRYVSLFPLAFFNFTPERLKMFKSRFPGDSDLSTEERQFLDNLKNDFKQRAPNFIIFPKQLVPEGFDPYRYALSTGVFAEVANNYKLIENNERWRIFRLAEKNSL